MKFKVNFNNLFEVFLAKCTFLDQELSNYGETAHKNTLHEIFQLNNFNERTPPELIRRALILLIHIRNASSHGSKAGIVYINKKKSIRIRDYNRNGKLTFEEFFTFESLYDCYYILLFLIMEFELVALIISLHRVIRELNIKFNKRFKCSQCGYENVVLVHPKRTNVVYDKCKTRFSIINDSENESSLISK